MLLLLSIVNTTGFGFSCSAAQQLFTILSLYKQKFLIVNEAVTLKIIRIGFNLICFVDRIIFRYFMTQPLTK